MPYKYRVFQSNIVSDIAIQTLELSTETSNTIDIFINEDKSLHDKLSLFSSQERNYYKTNLKKTDIYIKDIALFAIDKNGFSIKYILKKIDMPSFFSKL